MRYHIIKASRAYDGHPYCGPASGDEPAEADTRAAAEALCAELTRRNPVGFVVIDTQETRDVTCFDCRCHPVCRHFDPLAPFPFTDDRQIGSYLKKLACAHAEVCAHYDPRSIDKETHEDITT